MNVSITQNRPPAVDGTSAKISVKLIVGIFFTLLGVLLTLDNLDLANADAVLPYWPLVLVAIGILKFQERRSRAFAVCPGARDTTVGPATLDREAAIPIWATGVPAASDTPGYPYRVHVAPEMFVKSMTW